MTAYLVSIDGPRGPEAQVWYGKPGEFVGRTDHAVMRLELPEREAPWSIEEALNYAQCHPDAVRS
jgi:hypothetical protein